MSKTLSATLAQILINRNWRFRGRTRLLSLLGKYCRGVPLTSRYGVKLAANLDDTTNRFCMDGAYGNGISNAIAGMNKGDAFVDIGSNVGLFSLLAAKSVGESGVVVAFEPQQKLAAQILENARFNGASNIFVVGAAVGSSTSIARMEVPITHSGTAFLTEGNGIRVFMVGPDVVAPILHAYVGERSTLIKIDVEGAEMSVLRALDGALGQMNVAGLIVEIDDNLLARFGSSRGDIYRFVTKRGFAPEKGEGTTGHFDEIFLPRGGRPQ